MLPWCKLLFYLTFPLTTLAVISGVRAQSINPDTSLGNENSVVNTIVDVGKGIPSDRIDGGATRGNNLFHSFSNFNVDAGRGAYFSNPAGIENIISRVTGSDVSNILGTLGVLGNANLFFANPNGIVFGPNARLDVSGSFFASTSDSFTFDNGFEFSASNPQAPPLLTVNMPIGLRFRDNPGSITVGNDQVNNPTPQSLSFEVQPEKTLAFVGGEINLNGRRLRAPGGRIELGALATEGTVGINDDFSLSFPENVALADVSINAAEVDVTSGDKGSVSINARNINLRGGADICAGIGADDNCGGLATNFGSVDSQAGDITLNALESISIANVGSRVINSVNSGGIGTGGNINIEARSVFLDDDSEILSSVSSGAIGKLGDIEIKADFLSISNSAAIATAIFGQGDAGNINVDVRNLQFLNGGQFSSVVRPGGEGKGGIIRITASDSIILSGTDITNSFSSGFFTITERDASGRAGDIFVQTDNLRITDGGIITATTSNSSEGGNIFINAKNFEALNGGQIVTAARSSGNAGTIKLNVTENIRISGVDSNFQQRLEGAKNIVETSETDRFATIDDVIFNEGAASGIFANTAVDSTGDGGNISIDPKTVEILDGARISTDSQGTGKPGNIFIQSDEILLLRRGGAISTNSAQDTDGGNITINTGVLVALPNENSDISANAKNGNGGNVNIEALGVFGILRRDASTDFSDITASSESGISGTITINNPEVDVNNGLVELPETVVDAKQQIAQNACQLGIKSELVVTGRGGLPPNPSQDLSSDVVRVGLATPVVSKNTSTNTTAIKPKPTPTEEKIVPAQGWVFNSKGQVVLTAYNPTKVGTQRIAQKALCGET